MNYALAIGFRYLRSKKTKTVSVITFIAVSGVALGVAALLAVMSITSGFQEEFRNKVLGVNAHVLVMRYGDFEEYRDVIARATDAAKAQALDVPAQAIAQRIYALTDNKRLVVQGNVRRWRAGEVRLPS